jgi:hypothetical protein
MLVYFENSAGGVQKANSDIEEDDEDKEHITDPMVNIIFILYL